MKKSIFLLFFIILFPFSLNSQTVDSIKVEQSGDFIKVRYKILNSTPDQLYRVKVLCSINGGMNTEIRSITGDVGDLVAGGKTEYWVVWDVLKDVEELKSVEFIVRAELVRNISESNKGDNIQWDKKKFHLMLATTFPGPQAGLKIGYMGSWGFSATFLYGKAGLNSHQRKDPDMGIPSKKVPYIGLELSKRIVNRNGFQMHLSAGPSYTRMLIVNRTTATYYTQRSIIFNIGTTLDIKRFTFCVGTASAGPGIHDRIEEGSSDNVSLLSSDSYLVAGLGIRF
jgi:hypothetical protein